MQITIGCVIQSCPRMKCTFWVLGSIKTNSSYVFCLRVAWFKSVCEYLFVRNKCFRDVSFFLLLSLSFSDKKALQKITYVQFDMTFQGHPNTLYSFNTGIKLHTQLTWLTCHCLLIANLEILIRTVGVGNAWLSSWWI